jgi:DNA-binding CsgD family transcriptional regulator
LFAESLDLARRTGMTANMAFALTGLALAGEGGPTRAGRPGCTTRPPRP